MAIASRRVGRAPPACYGAPCPSLCFLTPSRPADRPPDRAWGRTACARGGRAHIDRTRREPPEAQSRHRSTRRRLYPAGRARSIKPLKGVAPATARLIARRQVFGATAVVAADRPQSVDAVPADLVHSKS